MPVAGCQETDPRGRVAGFKFVSQLFYSLKNINPISFASPDDDHAKVLFKAIPMPW
jgi:hypothetical protein